jgi:hypothetical protein
MAGEIKIDSHTLTWGKSRLPASSIILWTGTGLRTSRTGSKIHRVYTRIGDVFVVRIGKTHKRYFQYVARDTTQLSSHVVRVFKRKYSTRNRPDLQCVVKPASGRAKIVEIQTSQFLASGRCGPSIRHLVTSVGSLTSIRILS